MANQRRFASFIALLTACLPSSAWAAKHQTANFIVTARDAGTARQVGQYAEQFRRQKAVEWLGAEMPTWPDPCTIEVRVTFGGAGGATSFAFDNGQILGQSMVVEGPLERILNSVLPHEITHTVFAHKFRRPLPRWADEGGSVLSEDQQEIARHDLMVRELIRGGRMIPLSRLFVLTEYPRDVMALYAQGFSVANYLVSQKGHGQYLDFVWEGQVGGWEKAVRQYYGYRNISDLEKHWIDWLIAGRGTGADGPPILAADTPRPNRQRVVRGQMPDEAPPRRNNGSGFQANEFEPPAYANNRNAYAVAQPTDRPEIEMAPASDRSRWLPPIPAPSGVGAGRSIPPAQAIEPYGQPAYGNDAAAYRGFDARTNSVPQRPPAATAVGAPAFEPPANRNIASGDRAASRVAASANAADAEPDEPTDRRPRRIIPVAVGRTRRAGS